MKTIDQPILDKLSAFCLSSYNTNRLRAVVRHSSVIMSFYSIIRRSTLHYLVLHTFYFRRGLFGLKKKKVPKLHLTVTVIKDCIAFSFFAMNFY
jgi:hypothetical protein